MLHWRGPWLSPGAPKPCKVYLSLQMVRGASNWHLRWLSPAFAQSVGQYCPLGSISCTQKEAFSICYHFCQMGSKGKSPGYLRCSDSSARPRVTTEGAQGAEFTDMIPLAGNDKLLQAKNLSNGWKNTSWAQEEELPHSCPETQ